MFFLVPLRLRVGAAMSETEGKAALTAGILQYNTIQLLSTNQSDCSI